MKAAGGIIRAESIHGFRYTRTSQSYLPVITTFLCVEFSLKRQMAAELKNEPMTKPPSHPLTIGELKSPVPK